MVGAATVLVIGVGGLGLWGIQWAKTLLPPQTKVFVADITVSEWRNKARVDLNYQCISLEYYILEIILYFQTE